VLELDHVFCFVDPEEDWPARVASAGWRLDPGTASPTDVGRATPPEAARRWIEHPGQGTRSRRLFMAEHYVEMLWLASRADALANPLRLDRRADWRTTGASPFGIGLRGAIADHDDYWPYRPTYAADATIWIHRSPDDQPLIFVFEATREQIERFVPRNRFAATPELVNGGAIRGIRLQLPSPPPAVLEHVAPCLHWELGPPRMEIVIAGGTPLEISAELALRG
jgi:hypothetical protein